MFPYNYALEKLSNAVRILATGEGDVRSRLWPAFLEFHTLQVKDFPLPLQADFDLILKELTKREPQDQLDRLEWATEGSVQANLRRMINRTGSRIARKICDLQFHVELAYEEWRQSLGKPTK